MTVISITELPRPRGTIVDVGPTCSRASRFFRVESDDPENAFNDAMSSTGLPHWADPHPDDPELLCTTRHLFGKEGPLVVVIEVGYRRYSEPAAHNPQPTTGVTRWTARGVLIAVAILATLVLAALSAGVLIGRALCDVAAGAVVTRTAGSARPTNSVPAGAVPFGRETAEGAHTPAAQQPAVVPDAAGIDRTRTLRPADTITPPRAGSPTEAVGRRSQRRQGTSAMFGRELLQPPANNGIAGVHPIRQADTDGSGLAPTTPAATLAIAACYPGDAAGNAPSGFDPNRPIAAVMRTAGSARPTKTEADTVPVYDPEFSARAGRARPAGSVLFGCRLPAPAWLGISAGRRPVASRAGLWRVTAYCPCRICCGPRACGITASGRRAVGRLVAADTRVLPFGTRVVVPGYGAATVADTGSAIVGRRLDVLFPTHGQAKAWGVRWVNVEVLTTETQRTQRGAAI